MTELQVRVATRRAETQDICSFELVAADGAELPAFGAGAHIDVHVPGGLTRQYSLCNPPTERHRYLIAALKDAGTFLLAARADNSALATATAGPVSGSLMVAAGNENSRGTGRFINGSLVYSTKAMRVIASYARLRQNAEQILPAANPE